MAREHQAEADCKIHFSTPNKVTTTSETEWEAVVKPEKDKAYPEREGTGSHERMHRSILGLDTMLERMEVECNSKLRRAGHSELIKEELVGGRMYTGELARRRLSYSPRPHPPYASSLYRAMLHQV